jgi:hypothetical protein
VSFTFELSPKSAHWSFRPIWIATAEAAHRSWSFAVPAQRFSPPAILILTSTADTERSFALWSLQNFNNAASPPRTLDTLRPLRPAASASCVAVLIQAPAHFRKSALAEQSYRCSLPPVTRWFANHQRSCRPCPACAVFPPHDLLTGHHIASSCFQPSAFTQRSFEHLA